VDMDAPESSKEVDFLFKDTINVQLSTKSVDTIRILSADMVERANSGHVGAAMGCAPMAHVLWRYIMDYSPANPKWANRDRFVLSNGHGCALQYSMLHLVGYEVSMDDLKAFRQLNSHTPGHPEHIHTPGVEVATGPLGQGISNAVGLAVAQAHMAAVFNRPGFPVIDNFTYAICGDGCLQEGVSSEASSMAGHMGLGRLIVLYDSNNITIDGDTELSFTEDVVMRYNSYGWHTQTVEDGTDLQSIADAITRAKHVTDRPSIIKVHTVIGHGSKNQGTACVHGNPLGDEDLKYVKDKFGFDPEQTFVVPEEVAADYGSMKAVGKEKYRTWQDMFAKYKELYGELAMEFERRMAGEVPENILDLLPTFTPEEKGKATRKHSYGALNCVAPKVPELVGGSADLTPSNLTWMECSSNFSPGNPEGRYLRYGIREHGMVAVANGMAAYGGVRPFVATFLNFIGYAMGAVRLSALSQFPVLFIMTHDSIALGEDGPTHQPIETLESLRAMPNLYTFRPADGNETSGCYACALSLTKSPSVLCMTRQTVPNLPGTDKAKVALGGYTVVQPSGAQKPDLIMVATGSEVHLCTAAAQVLDSDAKDVRRVRVVSMPCQELFDEQSEDYRLSVFTPGVPVLSVEAAGPHGWHKYAHAVWGINNRFGASGTSKDCLEYFGFTVENITEQAKKVIEFYSSRPAPSLVLRPQLDMTK